MHAASPVARTQERAARGLLVCGMLAPLLLAAFITAAALLTTDYTPLYDTISQLGARGTPHANLMNAGFIISGLLIGAFSYGLYCHMGRTVLAKIVWLLLAIDSVGIVLSGVFQADSKVLGLTGTPEGSLHSVFAYVAFFAFLTGIAAFARLTHREPAWRGFTALSSAVFVINLVLVALYIAGASWAGIGALELAFFGMSLVWLVAVSLRALGIGAGAAARESAGRG